MTGEKPSGRKRGTIIVPARKEGFEETLLGEDCWYATRISAGLLDRIKYIAGYRTQPVLAITHYAAVFRIEPHGEGGKCRCLFAESSKPIGHALWKRPSRDHAAHALQLVRTPARGPNVNRLPGQYLTLCRMLLFPGTRFRTRFGRRLAPDLIQLRAWN